MLAVATAAATMNEQSAAEQAAIAEHYSIEYEFIDESLISCLLPSWQQVQQPS